MHAHNTHLLLPGRKMHRIAIIILAAAIILASCSTETRTSKIVVVQNSSGSQQQATPQPAQNQNIACYSDSDCGARRAENAYCFQDNPVGDLYSWKCNNPGTVQANCQESHTKGPIATCGDTYFCYKGECIPFANCNDSDGGKNYEVAGKVTTNDFAVHEDHCKNSGELVEYYCSSDNRAFSETKSCKCDGDECAV